MPSLEQKAGRELGGTGAQDTPVRVALIGCGGVSEYLYAGALHALAGEGLLGVAALVDPDLSRRSRIATLFPSARQYRDTATMLAEIAPELAIIAAPHRLHAQLAIMCLEEAVHVLCEKPMALSAAECDQMIEASRTNQRLLAVGHFRRFYPSCQTVKSVLDSKLLGPVTAFHFYEGRIYDWPAQSASTFQKEEAGGGVLVDTGAHTIDLLLWWLGDAMDILQYQHDAMGGVEANCRLALKTASGAEGLVQLSRDWPLPNRYVIHCERGWIAYSCDIPNRLQWGLSKSAYILSTELGEVAKDSLVIADPIGRRASSNVRDYFTAQLRNVVFSIRGRDSLGVTGDDARKAVALIEACYRKRELFDMPWLDEAELRRARTLLYAH